MKLRIDAPDRERLAFLDGLRGLAALYVVLFHAMVEAHASGRSTSAPAVAAFAALRHGHYAVDVFIVLSGYGLMRPVARDLGGRLAGGLLGHLGRRARRIIPPYYAALGLCWLLAATVPSLGRLGGGPWDLALPSGGLGVVASHLLLVHNWGPGWIYRINPPAWTVATEWQIYLLFPALIALRRRLGAAATVAVAFGLGWAIAGLGPTVANPAMVRLCPWLLGLFALGMAAATDGDGQGPVRRPLGWIGAAVVALGVPLWLGAPNRDVMLADPIVGALAALGIARLARRSARGETSPVLRLLSSPAAGRLGSISYSLYLIHFPLLALAGSLLRSRGVGPGAQLAATLGLAAPGCVAAAGLFAVVFERRSLARRTGRAAPSRRRDPAGCAGPARDGTAGAA